MILLKFLICVLLTQVSLIRTQLIDNILEIQNSNNVYMQTYTDLTSINGFSLDIYFYVSNLDLSLDYNYTLFNYQTMTQNTIINFNFKNNLIYILFSNKWYTFSLAQIGYHIDRNSTMNFFHLGTSNSVLTIMLTNSINIYTDNLIVTNPNLDGPGLLTLSQTNLNMNLKFHKFIYYNISTQDYTGQNVYQNTINKISLPISSNPYILYNFNQTNGNIISNLANLYLDLNITGSQNLDYIWLLSEINLIKNYNSFNTGFNTIHLELQGSNRFYLENIYYKINNFEYFTPTLLDQNNNLISTLIFNSKFNISTYPIFISNDQINFVKTDSTMSYIDPLSLISDNNIIYNQPYASNPNLYYSAFNLNYILYAALGISSLLIIIFILMNFVCDSDLILNQLSISDYLRLQIRDKTPIKYDEITTSTNFDTETLRKNNIINEEKRFGVGISYKIHKQTTAIGGLFTIICCIITISLLTIYLYDSVVNNIQINTNTSNSNGLIVNTINSSLNISLTFPYISEFTSCISGNIDNRIITNSICSFLFSLDITGIKYGNSFEFTCSQYPSEIENYKTCLVNMRIYNYTDIGQNAVISFSSLYAVNLYLNTSISINSYIQNSEISNNLSPSTGKIISFPLQLYYSLTPVSYTYFGNPLSTGYLLDYTSRIFTEYSIDQISNSNYGVQNSIVFNFQKNNNWLYINIDSKYSYIVIFAQFFAIITGVFSIGKYIPQILCSEFLRKIVFKISWLRRKFAKN